MPQLERQGVDGPIAIIAEDEPLLADELVEQLAVLWPQLRIAARVCDGAAALQVIEAEGSRTLTEMRQLVAALRDGDDPELAPGRGLGDLERLARRDGGPPTVDVQVSAGLDDLGPTVGAAIYRIAQESVTNALRHARRATRVSVRVAGEGSSVRLSIEDDGEAVAAGRGWMVTALLPRSTAR